MSDTKEIVNTNSITIPKTYDPAESAILFRIAGGLFKSGLFPNAKNENGAFAIIQYGRELGVPPMMALKNINIISGQLACNGQLMLSLAMHNGVTYQVIEENEKGTKLRFKRGDITYDASFTFEEAKIAGLTGKDNWKKYPQDMCFWRAVAKGLRRIAPDIIMGLYTADEVSNGTVINIEATQVDPIAEGDKHAENEALKKLDVLPPNIKKSLEEIDCKTPAKKWEFCNMYDFDNAKILKAINGVKEQRKKAEDLKKKPFAQEIKDSDTLGNAKQIDPGKPTEQQMKDDLKNLSKLNKASLWAHFKADIKAIHSFCANFNFDNKQITNEIGKLKKKTAPA